MSKNSSSAKRAVIALRNRSRNKIYKSAIKTYTKKFLISLHESQQFDYDYSMNHLSNLYQKIDKAVKRGVIHKNKGARCKSVLAQAIKAKLNN
uniref:Small ribosomal subunit protein bS20c n=1 Tax=Spyridia filamentosa TaxID=196632 RepID=A0A1Z1MJZ1_SPYFI|nr:ribosomal protein S20 [Spyridia filamentosa]ARW66209.1 ribosomal protein S20 [Spyridia filamentosa]